MRAASTHGIRRTLNGGWRRTDSHASKPPTQCCSGDKGD